MKTRDRILESARRLFNEEGTEKSSTNKISAELNISSGNLYYHFKTKYKIVDALVLRAETRLDAIIAATPAARGIDDFWFSLHLVFETLYEYRFVFRDAEHLMRDSASNALRLRRMTRNIDQSARSLCRAMIAVDVVRASDVEVNSLATHVAFAVTCWFNFARLQDSGSDSEVAGRAAYHVLTLFLPYLPAQERAFVDYLRGKYLT